MEADSSSNQRPVIQASEILAKIERGEDVEYDSVIVEGDLDISGLELPKKQVDRRGYEKSLALHEELKLVSSQITVKNSVIRNFVKLNNIYFKNNIDFVRTEFEDDAFFVEATFTGRHTSFRGAMFGEDANFHGAKFISRFTNFVGAKFTGRYTNFGEVKFTGMSVNFEGARFTGREAYFRGAKFTGKYVNFRRTEFDGYANFKDTEFKYPGSQEVTCRIIKREMEEQGNKHDADYYFYREMEAIRIQNGIKGTNKWLSIFRSKIAQMPSGIKKCLRPNNIKERSLQLIYKTIEMPSRINRCLRPNNIKEQLSHLRYEIVDISSKFKRLLIYDVVEYIFIQRVFGYGVRPFNVAKAWLSVVFFLGVVYWAGAGVVKGEDPLEWYEYFYFSIVTAATPGYAGYTPTSGFYTLIAGAQAIFGTFMWAAFIATFARKWQR